MIPTHRGRCQAAAAGGLAALAFLLTTPTPGKAGVWTVLSDGTGDFPTIQSALLAAATGDTVEVGPGVWYESLARAGDIVLRSQGGPEVTVLDGRATSPLLLLDAGEASEIEGLTFTRALRNEGGAIRVGSGAATVRDCRFIANRAAERGGAILTDAGVRLVVEDCLFRDNETPEVGTGASVGAALTSRFSASIAIRRCSFEGNVARRGGALALQNTASVQVEDCVFRENVATEAGGAIRFVRSSFDVQRCTFIGNRCPTGSGGVFHAEGSDGLFRGNVHVENEAGAGGVGALAGSRLRFLSETVVGCRSPLGSALRLRDLSEAFVRNDIFADLAGSPVARCAAGSTLWPACNLAWDVDPGSIPAASGGDDCSVEATALAADPRFCGGGDYHLRTDSPAADAPGCGLLGALEPACNPPTALAGLSWGRLRAPYR